MRLVEPGLDRWEHWFVPDEVGTWSFHVEGWHDPYSTWEHAARVKVPAGIDVELVLAEGALLLERAAAGPRDRGTFLAALSRVRDTALLPEERLSAALSPEVLAALLRSPLRDRVTLGPERLLLVERPLALAGAWYEIFPRSEGARRDASGRWLSGTLATAAEGLERIAGMGFDVVYLTPVHPIGATHRKGRNNALEAGLDDPGSPYAIGSSEGGHDSLHPDLGTFDDFDDFVARSRSLGMEVALDLALQASPDHPWVSEHPEWFAQRPDGSIAYAENPPKKYQDIYPLSFDRDPVGLAEEILRTVLLWVAHGVTLFRVDNPHTKPVEFWEWLIREVRSRHPDVIFLAEAFTRPPMMQTLAKVGFTQSYTYFTWRNTRAELEEYLSELTSGADEPTLSGAPGTADFLRPSLWPTTHDILTPYVQQGWEASAVRAVLAATLSPTYGVYNGFELVEDRPRPGVEEQLDNEKYEYRPRDHARAVAEGMSLAPLLQQLNSFRRSHPALSQLRRLTFHDAEDSRFVVYSRHLPAHLSPAGVSDTVLVVVNLDPHSTRDTVVHLDLAALDLGPSSFQVRDFLTGEVYEWSEDAYVRLGPGRCAHLLEVVRSSA